MRKKLGFLLEIFLVSFIVIVLLIFIYDKVKNIYFFSIVTILSVVLLVFSIIFNKENVTNSMEGSIRYSMLCNKCHWEWMSHITEEKPKKCPNCSHFDDLEIIGWRRVVSASKKRNKELTNYFK